MADMDSSRNDEETRPLASADRAYHSAVFGGDASGLRSALHGLRAADPADPSTHLARGRLLHAGHLAGATDLDSTAAGGHLDEEECFNEAYSGFLARGDLAGQARARFWQGCYWQVVREDQDRALTFLRPALELSVAAGDALTESYALRHLGIAAFVTGDAEEARVLLERSVALRRGLGFDAGVAANLIGLAHLAVEGGELDRAVATAEEALALATAAEADAIAAQAREVLGRIGDRE